VREALLKFGKERVVVPIDVIRPEPKIVNLGILRLKEDLPVEVPSEKAMG
jgi:hypothetical protein